MRPKPREENTTAVPDGQSKGATRKRANHKIPWSSGGLGSLGLAAVIRSTPSHRPRHSVEYGYQPHAAAAAAWGVFLFFAAIHESTFEEVANHNVHVKFDIGVRTIGDRIGISHRKNMPRTGDGEEIFGYFRLAECMVSQNRKMARGEYSSQDQRKGAKRSQVHFPLPGYNERYRNIRESSQRHHTTRCRLLHVPRCGWYSSM